MTRSASPNGQVEFSYDFPVASTSQLPPTPSSRTTHKRPRSPQRPRWESSQKYYAADNDDDDEALALDDEIDYDAFGYPYPASIATRTRRAHTHPAPTPTRNQWRAPSPPLYPFGQTSTTTTYPYSAPLLLAPPAPHHMQVASSCESTCSMLSACSRASKEKKEPHQHAKIRKPRRSVDSDSPPSLAPPSSFSSPASSPGSSPYLSTYGDDFDADEEEQERRSAHSVEDEEEDEEEKQQHEGHAPSSLRRQWAALSLRVRFGVFRAKRRMRNRVMSL